MYVPVLGGSSRPGRRWQAKAACAGAGAGATCLLPHPQHDSELLCLPPELLGEVAKHLPVRSLLQLRLTCKAAQHLVDGGWATQHGGHAGSVGNHHASTSNIDEQQQPQALHGVSLAAASGVPAQTGGVLAPYSSCFGMLAIDPSANCPSRSSLILRRATHLSIRSYDPTAPQQLALQPPPQQPPAQPGRQQPQRQQQKGRQAQRQQQPARQQQPQNQQQPLTAQQLTAQAVHLIREAPGLSSIFIHDQPLPLTSGQLKDLCLWCPRLGSLRLPGLSFWGGGSLGPWGCIPGLANLQCLDVELSDTMHLKAALSELGKLTKLVARGNDPESVCLIPPTAIAAVPSLRSLSLSHASVGFRFFENTLESLHPSRMPALTHLSLGVELVDDLLLAAAAAGALAPATSPTISDMGAAPGVASGAGSAHGAAHGLQHLRMGPCAQVNGRLAWHCSTPDILAACSSSLLTLQLPTMAVVAGGSSNSNSSGTSGGTSLCFPALQQLTVLELLQPTIRDLSHEAYLSSELASHRPRAATQDTWAANNNGSSSQSHLQQGALAAPAGTATQLLGFGSPSSYVQAAAAAAAMLHGASHVVPGAGASMGPTAAGVGLCQGRAPDATEVAAGTGTRSDGLRAVALPPAAKGTLRRLAPYLQAVCLSGHLPDLSQQGVHEEGQEDDVTAHAMAQALNAALLMSDVPASLCSLSLFLWDQGHPLPCGDVKENGSGGVTAAAVATAASATAAVTAAAVAAGLTLEPASAAVAGSEAPLTQLLASLLDPPDRAGPGLTGLRHLAVVCPPVVLTHASTLAWMGESKLRNLRSLQLCMGQVAPGALCAIASSLPQLRSLAVTAVTGMSWPHMRAVTKEVGPLLCMPCLEHLELGGISQAGSVTLVLQQLLRPLPAPGLSPLLSSFALRLMHGVQLPAAGKPSAQLQEARSQVVHSLPGICVEVLEAGEASISEDKAQRSVL